MTRRRQSRRGPMRLYREIGLALEREAKRAEAVRRCGCAVDAPEADPTRYRCPCGAHCQDCIR